MTRFFSIQPGERRKTLLLYGLHFVFWLGLRWGDTASYTLFLSDRGAEGLSLMFVGNAALAFIIGLVYNSFADRVSNERLLLILIGLTLLWLMSVQVLLLHDVYGGPGSIVYPYFYLAFVAVADLTSLHVLNYISDFYDTRSAKRALPFLLSAGFAGAIVAGLSIQFLALQYIPLAWAASLVAMIGFVYLIRRQLPEDIKRIWQANRDRRGSRESGVQESGWENLRDGFRFVRASGILRWLALSTLVLVILMKLLTFQASQIFEVQFRGNPEAFKDFNGTIGWVSNVVGLLLPSLVFQPILARLGVGATNTIFPLITLLSVSALGYLPNLYTAILGRLTDRMFKKAFRNPTNAMLYNSVPLNIKNRARGFINGLVVPLGTLTTGLMLISLQAGRFVPETLAALGILIGAAYVLATLRVRREYRHALVDMLAQDELGIFRAISRWRTTSPADSGSLAPTTLILLYEKLDSTQDEHVAIFLAELLYDLQGRKALSRLQQLAMQRSSQVRLSIIRMLSDDQISDPIARGLYLAGLADADVRVRRAAVIALAQSPDAAYNETLLSTFLTQLNDPDETVQASVIPPLMASGDFHYLAPAVKVLSGWLSSEASERHRVLGLRVLFETGDERLARTLTRYLNDFAPLVRAQAVELIGRLTAKSSRETFRRWGIDTLRTLLADRDEDVRLTAVNNLGQIQSAEASRALLVALSDRSFKVRRQACAVMPVLLQSEIKQALDSDDPRLSESAAFILVRAWRRSVREYARHRIGEHIEALVAGAYRFCLQCSVLQAVDTAGARLLTTALREEAHKLIEQALWLVSALSDDADARRPHEASAIRQSLRSNNPLTQINAIETLEAATSPRIARLVAPLYDGAALSELAQIGQDLLELPLPSQRQVFQLADGTAIHDEDQNALLAAIAMYTLLEMNEAGVLFDHDDEQLSAEQISLTAQTMLNASDPVARETARLVLARLDATDKARVEERSMLTAIEKMISLKKVPVFQGMSVDKLRLLADISEEATYAGNQQIFAEGEQWDALYVIVSGQVGIQRRTPENADAIIHLATLGPGECFAEMSLFDDAPYSADAVAIEPAELLLVRQDPLVAVIKQHPDLAVSLFKVLSQRLRQANEVIAQYKSRE